MVFYNNWLAKLMLFGNYSTIMLFGLILTKKEKLSDESLRHEKIHQLQFFEVTILFFTILALIVFILAMKGELSGYHGFLLIIPPCMYYVIYGVEWLISFIHWFFSTKKKDMVKANGKAYRNSAMEMEAYDNQGTIEYLDYRPPFSFIQYYGKI